LNQREVFIQKGASNRKFNTYEKISEGKRKGKFKKDKETLPGSILGLDSEASNCYEPASVTKVIDPTKKNYLQINVEGRLYNNDEGNTMYFRDKGCKSYTFVNLPVIVSGEDTTVASEVPSNSMRPSVAPSISQAPSALPSTSASPSVVPSISQAPTGVPSISMRPSVAPSISRVPSALPSTSASPSVVPSISQAPTGIPSISMMPSVAP
jgi:hypothetical protein